MIGVFGGTFDPVHYGHLKPARDVMDALGLDEVRFIPNLIPPHREPPWLSAEQRLQLLELALQDKPGFVLDDREINRDGKSYMVDTLISLRHDFPKVQLCLILGMDAMYGVKQWSRWQKILELCHIVVTQRPGYEWGGGAGLDWIEAFRTDEVGDLKREECGRILLQSATQVDISASEIRQLINNGQDVSSWLPEKVNRQLLEMNRSGVI